MDKGIRPAVNRHFVELLPRRAELGNTRFRAEVIAFAMEDYSITLASAATHYNHAFKEAKKVPELAATLEGLGRAEDKKGGRKPKVRPSVPTVEVEVDAEKTEFSVFVKSTGAIVAEALRFEEAQTLICRAARQKKAKLYFL
jgi:23S rRNA G2445 N2-methylase RlmL